MSNRVLRGFAFGIACGWTSLAFAGDAPPLSPSDTSAPIVAVPTSSEPVKRMVIEFLPIPQPRLTNPPDGSFSTDWQPATLTRTKSADVVWAPTRADNIAAVPTRAAPVTAAPKLLPLRTEWVPNIPKAVQFQETPPSASLPRPRVSSPSEPLEGTIRFRYHTIDANPQDLPPIIILPLPKAKPKETLPLPKPVETKPKPVPVPQPEVVEPKRLPPPRPRELPPMKSTEPLSMPKTLPPWIEPESEPKPPPPRGAAIEEDGMMEVLLGPNLSTTKVIVNEVDATHRWYLQPEFVLAWATRPRIPTLATTGTPGSFGFLGQPGTTALVGPGKYGDDARTAFRVRGGWQFASSPYGLDGSFFILNQDTTTNRLTSDRFTTIARPFLNINNGREFSELVAFPEFAQGSLLIRQTTDFWGADVNLRRAIGNANGLVSRVELFAGYRYLSLRDTLQINEDLQALANAPAPVGTRVQIEDDFRTTNDFHGGQVGFASRRDFGPLSLDARGSLAFGVSRQEIGIRGRQYISRPGAATESVNVGILAQNTNSGIRHQDRFSVVPEGIANLGWQFRPHAKVFVGYSFTGWTSVLRASEQIDRSVDISGIPFAPVLPTATMDRPLNRFIQSDFWMHGLQFGLRGEW